MMECKPCTDYLNKIDNLEKELLIQKEENKNLQLTINSYEIRLITLQSQIENPVKNKRILDLEKTNELLEFEIKSIKEFKKDDINISISNFKKENHKLKEDNKDLLFRISKLEQNSDNISEEIINNKISDALKQQEIRYNEIISDKNDELNNFRKLLNRDIKETQSIPELPKNNKDLLCIIYNRFNEKNKPVLKNDLSVTCCFENKKISNGITCNKCFRSYKLNKNNLLINYIHEKHIIKNEELILNSITCDICKKVYQKKINICISCNRAEKLKYLKNNLFIYKDVPPNSIYPNTFNLVNNNTYKHLTIEYELYKSAENEGITIHDLKELIDYVRENTKSDKSSRYIKNRILRSFIIMNIYNKKQYENFQDIIKRINFNIDEIVNLPDDKFNDFKEYLIGRLNEISNNNISIVDNEIIPDDSVKYFSNKENCLECKKYEKGFCEKHFQEYQDNQVDYTDDDIETSSDDESEY